MSANLAVLATERPRHVTPARSLRRQQSKARAKVATAFRQLGNGSDAKTAHQRTTAWYRSSRIDWARCLG